MKAILVGILKDHPQAIYYSLRSFYLERRDIERSTGQKAASPNDDDTLTSSRLAEEFMSNLRKVHPVLWSKLESILEDLIVRFRPSYDAELLHSIVALIEKASKPEYKTSKDSKDSGSEVSGHVDACTKTLHLLGTKFFNFNKEKPDSAITRKAALFQSKFCDEFKRDFLLEKEGLKGDDLLAKLHKWKKLLERGISRVPKTSSLQEVSPSLSWFSSQPPDLWAGACESKSLNISNSHHDSYGSLDNALFHAKRSSALAAAKASSHAVLVAANAEGMGGHSGAAVVEIPGQYAPTSSSILDSRPIPELHAKLVRFHQTLELTSSSTKQHVHQITMIGSDGKMHKFLLQLAIPYWIRTDERSAQVNYVIRKTLRRDFRACRRSLTTRPSVVIPVAQRMRMSANQSSHESLDSIFCHVQGPKTSMLPAYFQEKVAEITGLRVQSIGENGEENETQVSNQAKLDVYHDICRKLVLPNVLSKYMSGMISSTEQLYRFRHVFSSQLAANSLLQYALSIVERTPNRFAFCSATGQMISQDFRSQYNHGV
jgi:transformation/transcription domain-associated protein